MSNQYAKNTGSKFFNAKSRLINAKIIIDPVEMLAMVIRAK
jgi:hypothetical protein